MIKKILFSFFLFLVIFTSFSQDKPTLISGKIVDSIGVIKNANIINLKSNQGTFSNDNGEFRMFVQLGDSLQISSVQHISKKIEIDENIIESKIIRVLLSYNTYNLEEFELKRHDLLGRLGIDTKSVPSDKKDSILRSVMDLSRMSMSPPADEDFTDRHIRPNQVITDPTAKFVGAGAAASMPFKHSERLWALRKKLATKKVFPYKILSELGDKFFFDELKISVEDYFHFLEYCNPLGVEDLHKNGNVLEVIKIFRNESISYLKLVKKK